MNAHTIKTGDAGISESIGFLLIFTMVIVGIGLVTLYGYPMLLSEQTSADTQIMQKSMIVLQNDVKSLTFKSVPYKETMLNTGSGQLVVYNSTDPRSLNSGFTIRYIAGATLSNFHPGELRYSSNNAGTVISLQNGAVVTHDNVVTGSAMLAQPRWFYDSNTNTMVINLIAFNTTSPALSKGGVANVQMKMKETNYTVIPTTDTVCLAYTPDTTAGGDNYRDAWDNYFVITMKMVKGGGCPGANEYKLPITPPGTLVIKKYDVEIVAL